MMDMQPTIPTGTAPAVPLTEAALCRWLGAAAPGTPVNLEVDVLAKYVEKLVNAA